MLWFSILCMAVALAGCALLPSGSAQPQRLHILPNDRIFLVVAPFDSVTQAELTHLELNPEKLYGDLVSELQYQLYLHKHEEAADSADATVRMTLSIRRLQPGAGNSGTFIEGSLTAERGGSGPETVALEIRQPAKANVPQEFLPLQVPRALAAEIMDRLETPKSTSSEFTTPQLILLH